MFAEAFIKSVGDKHGNISTGTRDRSDKRSDNTTGKNIGRDLSNRLAVWQNTGDLFRRFCLCAFTAGKDPLYTGNDFRNSKKTDQHGDKAQTAFEACDTKGEALFGIRRVEADSAEKHAEERTDQPLSDGLAGNRDDDREPEDSQHQHLCRGKLHGNLCHQRRKESHDQSADDTAAERGEHGYRQCLARFTFLCHGIAIQQSSSSRRSSGSMNQNGRNGSAVHAAAVDPEQQTDRGNQVHAKGEGNQQGNTHGSCHSRNSTEKYAACSAEERHE